MLPDRKRLIRKYFAIDGNAVVLKARPRKDFVLKEEQEYYNRTQAGRVVGTLDNLTACVIEFPRQRLRILPYQIRQAYDVE